jgi:hypothetical protein
VFEVVSGSYIFYLDSEFNVKRTVTGGNATIIDITTSIAPSKPDLLAVDSTNKIIFTTDTNNRNITIIHCNESFTSADWHTQLLYPSLAENIKDISFVNGRLFWLVNNEIKYMEYNTDVDISEIKTNKICKISSLGNLTSPQWVSLGASSPQSEGNVFRATSNGTGLTNYTSTVDMFDDEVTIPDSALDYLSIDSLAIPVQSSAADLVYFPYNDNYIGRISTADVATGEDPPDHVFTQILVPENVTFNSNTEMTMYIN